MRTVPCIAGCDGPMLTVISSCGSSCSSSVRSWTSLRPNTSCLRSALAMIGPLDRVDRQIVAAHVRLALLLGIVVAKRVADELLLHVDPAQIGMVIERHAVHVERLALLQVERG